MQENLQILNSTSKGYLPIIDFESWRVAFLRYADAVERKQLHRVERHMETDEVFVLLAGRACLIVEEDSREEADAAADAPGFSLISMLPETVYNVRKAVWHHIVLSKDAAVLIVENSNTDYVNSEYRELTPDERRGMISSIPPL